MSTYSQAVDATGRPYFARNSRVLERIMQTRLGFSFVEFTRSKSGKKLDKFLVKNFGFSLMMKAFSASRGFPPMPVLIIATTGRKSGQQRWTVMPYIKMPRAIYLIASNGARADDPFWVKNLQANPEATITVDRQKRTVRARMVDLHCDEYDGVWAFAKTLTPQYQIYQDKTTRPIPVIALE
jgi:deazaflavin-dependent oxidoreductase (nitroreductase family)